MKRTIYLLVLALSPWLFICAQNQAIRYDGNFLSVGNATPTNAYPFATDCFKGINWYYQGRSLCFTPMNNGLHIFSGNGNIDLYNNTNQCYNSIRCSRFYTYPYDLPNLPNAEAIEALPFKIKADKKAFDTGSLLKTIADAYPDAFITGRDGSQLVDIQALIAILVNEVQLLEETICAQQSKISSLKSSMP